MSAALAAESSGRACGSAAVPAWAALANSPALRQAPDRWADRVEAPAPAFGPAASGSPAPAAASAHALALSRTADKLARASATSAARAGRVITLIMTQGPRRRAPEVAPPGATESKTSCRGPAPIALRSRRRAAESCGRRATGRCRCPWSLVVKYRSKIRDRSSAEMPTPGVLEHDFDLPVGPLPRRRCAGGRRWASPDRR